MKYLIAALLITAFVIMPVMAFANATEKWERFGDTIKGDNENCPMLESIYIAKTFKDAVKLPIVGKADWRTELSYTSDINSIYGNRSVMLKTGLEF